MNIATFNIQIVAGCNPVEITYEESSDLQVYRTIQKSEHHIDNMVQLKFQLEINQNSELK